MCQQQAFAVALPEDFPRSCGTRVTIAGYPDDIDIEELFEQVGIVAVVAIAKVNGRINRLSLFAGPQCEREVAMRIGNDNYFHVSTVANGYID